MNVNWGLCVTYEELVARVGQARYEAACEWAWRTAAGTGQRDHSASWPDGLSDVPHDLSDLWFEGTTSLADRLSVALKIYEHMPCYANTMFIASHFDDFGREERSTMWAAYRAALESPDDRIADPIAYSLWVDFFEVDDRVEEAWRETAPQNLTPWEMRLRRVISNSGPVPWRLKAPLFGELIGDGAWHQPIYEGLLGSVFDVYGQVDKRAARSLLKRLTLGQDAQDLAALKKRLSRTGS